MAIEVWQNVGIYLLQILVLFLFIKFTSFRPICLRHLSRCAERLYKRIQIQNVLFCSVNVAFMLNEITSVSVHNLSKDMSLIMAAL